MKKIRFKELLLLSYKTKTAKRVDLNHQTILVKGPNGSGKSCIMKSLYYALGCNIKQFAPSWESSNIITSLKFYIDATSFQSIRMGNDYYLFNQNNKCILHSKNREKFSSKLRSYLGIATVSSENINTLNANSLFLPFYLDQDSGWTQPFESFGIIGNKKDALRFHTTIISDEYLNIKKHIKELTEQKKHLKNEIDKYQNLLTLFVKNLKDLPILSVDEKIFKDSISDLIRELEELNKKRNEYLVEIEKLNGEKYTLEFNISNLHKNIDGIEKDYNFALSENDVLFCPMCGAEIDNNESSRFIYLQDRDECKDRLISNEKKLDEINLELEGRLKSSNDIADNILKIQNILNRKQEDLSLKDYIESCVKEKIEMTLKEKRTYFNNKLIQVSSQLISLKGQLELEGKIERRKEIQKEFDKEIYLTMDRFGIKYSNANSKHSIFGKIKASGSIVPKMILVYQYTLLLIMSRYKCPLVAPIIIDGPKQNGIEQEKLNNILKYIIEHRPIETQLIISITDDENIDNVNDVHYISLNSNSNVMNQEDFSSVKSTIEKLLADNFMLES